MAEVPSSPVLSPAIRAARPGEGTAINAALRALSDDLGDPHPARGSDIEAALFGDPAVAHALVAEAPGEPALAGIAMFSPQFSTTRAAVGLYVSDLWVAPAWRGTGLGRRLLAAARDRSAARWEVGYLCLKTYATAPEALDFYRRLGFREDAGAHHLSIEAALLGPSGDPP